MRSILSVLAMAATLVTASLSGTAQAQDGYVGNRYYISGHLGGALTQTVGLTSPDAIILIFPPPNLPTGFRLENAEQGGLAVGIDTGPARFEVELLGQEYDIVVEGDPTYPVLKGDMAALMFNGYYDFGRSERIQPYVGIGMGEAEVDLGTVFVERFAVQAMAGVQFRLSRQTRLGAEYRFFRSRLPSGYEDFESSSILAKLTFYFR